MTNQISGTVHHVGQVEQVTASFTKRSLILVDASNPQYPQYIPIEATQEKVSLFDGIQPGHNVTVSINMRGNLAASRTTGEPVAFLSLQAWKVDFAQAVQQAQAPQPQYAPPVQQQAPQQAHLQQPQYQQPGQPQQGYQQSAPQYQNPPQPQYNQQQGAVPQNNDLPF